MNGEYLDDYTKLVIADPIPVDVRQWHPKRSTGDVCLVTPFAGKTHCFDHYLEGIKHLPTKEMAAVWYDNSNSKAFREKLISTGRRLFGSFTLLVDTTKHFTIESTLDYGRICWRTCQIYRTVEDFLGSHDYTFIVEDDVEIMPFVYEKLQEVLTREERIGTVVGSMLNRRMQDESVGYPVAWNFAINTSIPCNGIKATAIQIMQEKPFGVELIGSAHTGCWLTRTKLIKKLGFRFREDGVEFVDQVWGYRLNKAGYWLAIVWDAKTRHHWKLNGSSGWY